MTFRVKRPRSACRASPSGAGMRHRDASADPRGDRLDGAAGRAVGAPRTERRGEDDALSVAGAVDFPSRGSVEILGRTLGRTDVFRLREKIGFVDARAGRRFAPMLSVEEVVRTGATQTIGYFEERLAPADAARAAELLDVLGLARLAGRRFADCSHGERTRADRPRARATPASPAARRARSGLDLPVRELLLTARPPRRRRRSSRSSRPRTISRSSRRRPRMRCCSGTGSSSPADRSRTRSSTQRSRAASASASPSAARTAAGTPPRQREPCNSLLQGGSSTPRLVTTTGLATARV